MASHFLLSLLFAPLIALAQEPAIVTPIADGARIESLLNTAKSRATTELTARATIMSLTYSSPAPLNVLILYVTDGQFDPLDSLVARLPPGTRNTVNIDLTESPGWTPRERMYRLHFLSESTEGAAFEDIEFAGGSLWSIILAGLKQFIRPLPFSPSSYHRLPSYTVLGIPLVPLVGAMILFLSGWFLWSKNVQVALVIPITALLLYNLRFSMDTVRYSLTHSREWVRAQTYATAGALPQIGYDLLKENATEVYLCHTGTSFSKRT